MGQRAGSAVDTVMDRVKIELCMSDASHFPVVVHDDYSCNACGGTPSGQGGASVRLLCLKDVKSSTSCGTSGCLVIHPTVALPVISVLNWANPMVKVTFAIDSFS